MREDERRGGIHITGARLNILLIVVTVVVSIGGTKLVDGFLQQQKQDDAIAVAKDQAAQSKVDHDQITTMTEQIKGMTTQMKGMSDKFDKLENKVDNLQDSLNKHERSSRLRSDHMILPPYPDIQEHHNVRVIFSKGKWKYMAWVPRKEHPEIEDRKALIFCHGDNDGNTPEPEFDGGQILETLRFRIMRGCLSLNVPPPVYVIKRDGDGNIVRWRPNAADLLRTSEMR